MFDPLRSRVFPDAVAGHAATGISRTTIAARALHHPVAEGSFRSSSEAAPLRWRTVRAPAHAGAATRGQKLRSLLVEVVRRSVRRRVAVDQNQCPALPRELARHASREPGETVCVRQPELAHELNLVGRQLAALERGMGGLGPPRTLDADIREGMRRLRARGADLAIVYTPESSEPARRLYESVGFRVVNRWQYWQR